ncbi:MAG: S49 family peptidase, partial [Shewanella sp.]|nr:S49 family peptidase [Shewanella sp.]
GRKPIVAYVGGTAASAAYWIASAADEVVVDATARLGSIGVVMTLRRSKDDDQSETLEIVSSQSPNKRLDPASQKGRAAYQAQKDQLADVFIDRVARNMDVSRETVLEDFAQGGILIGQTAVDKGMAARLGSLEGVIAELGKGKSMSKETKTGANEGEGVTVALTGATALNAAALVAAVTEHNPELLAGLSAHFEPKQTMALEAAGEIAKACADAGVPSLSATLLTEGVTKAQAEAKIAAAGKLKDTLAAAGLSGSFEALLAHLDDPVTLAGKAIHEAKAATDESSDGSRFVGGKTETKQALSAKDVYAKRHGKYSK